MDRTIVRVRPSNGEWQIEADGARLKNVRERGEAIARAREFAHMHHGILIEDRYGRPLEREDYEG